MRLAIIGYEIIIRKAYFSGFHITDFSNHHEEKPYEHDFNINKRVNAMIKNHGFVDWIFRDFDIALMSFGDCAAIVLKDVMHSFKEIREKLKAAGANENHLSLYDGKIDKCFVSLCTIIENRKDYHVLDQIKHFNVLRYLSSEDKELNGVGQNE